MQYNLYSVDMSSILYPKYIHTKVQLVVQGDHGNGVWWKVNSFSGHGMKEYLIN